MPRARRAPVRGTAFFRNEVVVGRSTRRTADGKPRWEYRVSKALVGDPGERQPVWGARLWAVTKADLTKARRDIHRAFGPGAYVSKPAIAAHQPVPWFPERDHYRWHQTGVAVVPPPSQQSRFRAPSPP